MNEMLKLDNQLCFAFYVCSKEIIKKYRPLLEPLDLTYTGYICMLALWEKDNIPVKELGERLYLDSGTLTPLLKKLELRGYITRVRSSNDERTVNILLTQDGKNLQDSAANVPLGMMKSVGCGIENGRELLENLHKLMTELSTENNEKGE